EVAGSARERAQDPGGGGELLAESRRAPARRGPRLPGGTGCGLPARRHARTSGGDWCGDSITSGTALFLGFGIVLTRFSGDAGRKRAKRALIRGQGFAGDPTGAPVGFSHPPCPGHAVVAFAPSRGPKAEGRPTVAA